MLFLFLFIIYQFKVYSFSIPISFLSFSFLKNKEVIAETDKEEEKKIETDTKGEEIELKSDEVDNKEDLNEIDEITEELSIPKEKIETKKSASTIDKSSQKENSDDLELNNPNNVKVITDKANTSFLLFFIMSQTHPAEPPVAKRSSTITNFSNDLIAES